MRIFITGASGFAGSFLVERLIAEGHQITALEHPATSRQQLPAGVTVVLGDLLDVAGMKTAVAQARPDVIYHLAGQAYPARSWQIPGSTLAVNTVGTANLLDAAASYGRPRVVIITSADMYGHVPSDEMPITEQLLPQPSHPYGVSKWAAAQLAPLFWQRFELPVVEARPFNHIGPRQALGFVVPDFASQIAAIKLGQQEERMLVGNLDAQRDFTDVRDVVQAYIHLAEKGKAGEAYLICSSQPVKIHYILTKLAELADVELAIEYDPKRMRPSDTPLLYGSYRKIEQDTGWRPEITLYQSLADTLDYWLETLAKT